MERQLSTVVLCLALLLVNINGAISQENERGRLTTESRILRHSVNPNGTWIPWGTDPENNEPGIFPEVIELILEEAKFVGEPVVLPTKRAIHSLKNGQIDFDFVNPDWFPNGDVGKDFVTTLPVVMIKEYFVTLPTSKHQIINTQEIYGGVVGTIRGFYYYDDDSFTRMDFNSEKALVEGLGKKRFEVAILEEMTARYWSRKTNIELHYAVVHTEGKMVMRLNNSKAPFLPELNAAISRLQSQKKLEQVLDKYRVLYKFE